jgi:hypothetical protein
MGPAETELTELQPGYLREMLNVLSEFDLQSFECNAFKVEFKKPPPPPAVVEAISTDVRGFDAKANDDEPVDEEGEAALDRTHLHATAMRGFLPSLKPKKT